MMVHTSHVAYAGRKDVHYTQLDKEICLVIRPLEGNTEFHALPPANKYVILYNVVHIQKDPMCLAIE